MKSTIISLIFLAIVMVSHAEQFTLKEGITVGDATKALDECKYSHGNQYGLQWEANEGEDFLFCKLDANQTLVLVFSTETKIIKRLLVVTDQKRRKEYPIITPVAVTITSDFFSLVFSKPPVAER